MKLRILFLLFLPILLSCSSEENVEPEVEEANIMIEVVSYNYEVNTDDETEHLEFEIKFTNKSGFDVSGAPRITYKRMDNPDQTSTRSYNLDELPCDYLSSGGVCTFSYSNLENYNPELYGPDGPAELQIADVEYIILEEFR
jgi:hypothetical protein